MQAVDAATERERWGARTTRRPAAADEERDAERRKELPPLPLTTERERRGREIERGRRGEGRDGRRKTTGRTRGPGTGAVVLWCAVVHPTPWLASRARSSSSIRSPLAFDDALLARFGRGGSANARSPRGLTGFLALGLGESGVEGFHSAEGGGRRAGWKLARRASTSSTAARTPRGRARDGCRRAFFRGIRIVGTVPLARSPSGLHAALAGTSARVPNAVSGHHPARPRHARARETHTRARRTRATPICTSKTDGQNLRQFAAAPPLALSSAYSHNNAGRWPYPSAILRRAARVVAATVTLVFENARRDLVASVTLSAPPPRPARPSRVPAS